MMWRPVTQCSVVRSRTAWRARSTAISDTSQSHIRDEMRFRSTAIASVYSTPISCCTWRAACQQIHSEHREPSGTFRQGDVVPCHWHWRCPRVSSRVPVAEGGAAASSPPRCCCEGARARQWQPRSQAPHSAGAAAAPSPRRPRWSARGSSRATCGASWRMSVQPSHCRCDKRQQQQQQQQRRRARIAAWLCRSSRPSSSDTGRRCRRAARCCRSTTCCRCRCGDRAS